MDEAFESIKRDLQEAIEHAKGKPVNAKEPKAVLRVLAQGKPDKALTSDGGGEGFK